MIVLMRVRIRATSHCSVSTYKKVVIIVLFTECKATIPMECQIENVRLGTIFAKILDIIFNMIEKLFGAVIYYYKDKNDDLCFTLRITSNQLCCTFNLIIGATRMLHPLKTPSKILFLQIVTDCIVRRVY